MDLSFFPRDIQIYILATDPLLVLKGRLLNNYFKQRLSFYFDRQYGDKPVTPSEYLREFMISGSRYGINFKINDNHRDNDFYLIRNWDHETVAHLALSMYRLGFEPMIEFSNQYTILIYPRSKWYLHIYAIDLLTMHRIVKRRPTRLDPRLFILNYLTSLTTLNEGKDVNEIIWLYGYLATNLRVIFDEDISRFEPVDCRPIISTPQEIQQNIERVTDFNKTINNRLISYFTNPL